MFLFSRHQISGWAFRCDDWHCGVQCRCWEQLRENAYLMGQMVDADTAYITSRGLRTLGVRLRQHHESSLKVAEWLAEHPQVARS